MLNYTMSFNDLFQNIWDISKYTLFVKGHFFAFILHRSNTYQSKCEKLNYDDVALS